MKPISRPLISSPTAAPSANTQVGSSKPTQAMKAAQVVKQRSPEELHLGVNAWSLTTRDDGAVLAVASNQRHFEGAPSTGVADVHAVTLVPPSTQTENVKTIVMTGLRALGKPEFKITPYTFDTMDGPKVAFGNDSDDVKNVESVGNLPVVAALRFNRDFVPGDAGGPGDNNMQTYTIRAVDSLITLDVGETALATWKPMQTTAVGNDAVTSAFVGSATASALPTMSSASAGSALSGQSKAGLSKAEVAGIGAGAGSLLLLAGVGAALLFRKSKRAERAAKTEAFSLKILPKIDVEAFNKV